MTDQLCNTCVCVSCGLLQRPGELAFIEYSKGNLKLRRCMHCGKLVDKYVEYQATLVMMDIVLHELDAYRHVFFNNRVTRHLIARLAILVTLINTYIKVYASIQLGNAQWFGLGSAEDVASLGGLRVVILHYIIVLGLGTTETAIYCSSILGLVGIRSKLGERKQYQPPVTSSQMLDAVLVSCFPKLLFLPMTIWDYPTEYISVLLLFQAASNATALRSLLCCPTLAALSYVAFGLLVMYAFRIVVSLTCATWLPSSLIWN